MMPIFEKKEVDGDVILKNSYGIFSKKELECQLKEGRLTIKELGYIYDLKDYQMIHVLRILGISFRNDLSEIRIKNAEIDKSQHQVLLGTLLGDAYMPGNFYSLGHGVSQGDYCYHVAERLCNFVSSFGDYNVKAKTEKSFNFWTYRHKIFSLYLKRFYSRGLRKKYFTRESVFDLEPEGLAYWYMDDGKYCRYGANLCVGNINIEEGKNLIDLLKSNFSLHANLQFYDKKRNNYVIYILAKSRAHFYNLITPYIIPSMMYKITGDKFPKVGFRRDWVISRHFQLCTKAKKYIRYFGNSTVQKEVLRICSYLDPKKKYIEKIKELIAMNKIVSKPINQKR